MKIKGTKNETIDGSIWRITNVESYLKMVHPWIPLIFFRLIAGRYK